MQPDGRAVLEAILSGKAANYTPLAEKKEITLTVGLVQQYLCQPTRSGKLPTQQDCVKYIMMCMQRGLNPWAQDCYLLGYDSHKYGPQFSMVVAIQALLKRAELARTLDGAPAFDGMDSGVVIEQTVVEMDGEGVMHEMKSIVEVQGDLVPPGAKLLGGWAKVFRKDRSRPFYQRLSLDVYSKDTQMWGNDPGGMICKDAEAAGLRQAFPSDIGGLYLASEIEAFAEDAARISAAKQPSPTTGAGGHFNLDQLAKQAVNGQTQPANDGQSPDDGQDSGNSSANDAGQDSGQGAGAGQGSGSAGSEGSQVVPEVDKQEAAQAPLNEAQAAFDEELNNWRFDIDQASTHGALDKLADDAGSLAPGKMKTQVLSLIGQRRANIGKKKGNGGPASAVTSLLFGFVLLLAGSSVAAEPQTTRFYDARGNYVGRTTTYAGPTQRIGTTFYDARGNYAGRATTYPSPSTRPTGRK